MKHKIMRADLSVLNQKQRIYSTKDSYCNNSDIKKVLL